MSGRPRPVIGIIPAAAIMALVALAFSMMAIRSESQDREIERQAQTFATALYSQCQTSRRNATSLNEAFDVLANSTHGTDLTPAEMRAQSQAYRAAKPEIPDCGDRP